MELINILEPNKDAVVAKRNYICDNLNMVAIKPNKTKNELEHSENYYQILFSCQSSIVDDLIFLQCDFCIEPEEFDILSKYLYYLPNILANEKYKNMYDELMKEVDFRNIYFTDFIFGYDDNKFFIHSYRREDDKHCTLNNVYFTLKEYIKLKLIFKNLCVVDMIGTVINYAEQWTDIKLITAEDIYRGESTIEEDSHLLTHYRISEGALHFDFTYKIVNLFYNVKEIPQSSFLNYIDYNLYKKEYLDENVRTDTLVWNTFDVIPYKDRSVLILFNGYPITYKKHLGKFLQVTDFSTFGIIIEKDKISNTNFIDPINKIINMRGLMNNEENNI